MPKRILFSLLTALLFTALFVINIFAETESGTESSAGTQRIVSIEKPYPCFINGSIKRDELAGRLPSQVNIAVENPMGQLVERKAAVEWNLKNIPSIVDVSKAFVINGTVNDSLLEAEGITGGSRSVSVNVITASVGPVTTLRGKARIVTDLETEVELNLICPESADGFYIEYSTDRQEWKTFKNGADLWPELTNSDTKKIPPADIKANGEISMTYRLEIMRSKAVSGFWVRIRLEGSDHEGTSNECFFQPKDKSGESVWKPAGDNSGSGVQPEADQLGISDSFGLDDSPKESEETEESSSAPAETRPKRRSGGELPTEELPTESTSATDPSDDGSQNSSSDGGGYAAGGRYYGGDMNWDQEDEAGLEPEGLSWYVKLGIAAAVVGGILLAGYLVYRKYTKED